jgi:predicted 3-demethylubiquinone-9 3-methyltransferase (glyoxalase superfamily)
MQKIQLNLWYDGEAEAAARRYVSLVPDSAVGKVTRYPEVGQAVHGQPAGSAMTVEFRLGDTEFVALNGGPHFRFTPAISVFVTLEDEAAVDRLWEGLLDGGSALMPLDRYEWSPKYGWLADRWGLTWQIALGRHADVGHTAVPALLFGGERAGQAEAALGRYVEVFPGSRIEGLLRHDGSGVDAAGTVKHAQARLFGSDALMVMDSAAPHDFDFNEAVSLMVLCDDQSEIDRYWSALSAVPEAEQCGWLKDRFGVSWQIAPRALGTMLANGSRDQVARLMETFLAMKKLDLPRLERAFAA